jgi:hypothetical protein
MFRLGAVFLLGAFLALPQTPVSAGGSWLRIQRADPKTGAVATVFYVNADAGDPERNPAIEIACSDRKKPPLVLYRADVILDPQIHDTNSYYAAAIWALIKVDKDHLYRAVWDIGPAPTPREAKSAILDRRTIRELLRGNSLKVRFDAHNGQEFTDAFTIGGLDAEMVRDACGSKWFGKE